MTWLSAHPIRLLVILLAVTLVSAGCGGSGNDDDTPDEASFCRLAEQFAPVAEAPLRVLERLDELAPDDIDGAVVVLREAAEELEEHGPRSAERVQAEFEVRFRPDYTAARRQVESYISATCKKPRGSVTSTTTNGSADPATTDHDGGSEGGNMTDKNDDETEEEPDGTQN